MTKRTEDQKRHDRTLAMMLHLQDFSYREIAGIIERETDRSISSSQVRYDIKHVRDQWKEERLDNYEAYIHEELARLDSMEMELWKSWRESKDDLKQTRVEKALREVLNEEGDKATLDLVVSKIVETTQESPGDTKYLDMILRVQQERRKLLGLYAPTKLDIHSEHTLEIKGYNGVSPDDWPEERDDSELLEDGNTIEGEWEEAGAG